MSRFDDLPPEFKKLLILYGVFFIIAAVLTNDATQAPCFSYGVKLQG